MATPRPDKKFFKIGEVASLVGVKAHVLRYWESELGSSIRPLKTRGAHRMYRREDLATFCTVRALLKDEGLTLAAVKRRLGAAKVAREGVVGGRAEDALGEGVRAEGAPLDRVLGEVVLPDAAPRDGALGDVVRPEGAPAGAFSSGAPAHTPRTALPADVSRDAARALAMRAELLQVRNELSQLLGELDAPAPPRDEPGVGTATVTAVVPKTVLMQRGSDLRRSR